MSYKWWVLVAILLFAAGITLGAVTPANITADFFAEDLSALEQLGQLLAPYSLTTAIFIFVKNVSALVISFVLSPLLCLVPILALTVNGWLIVSLSPLIIGEESLGFLLAGILPHGVFEITALIMGEAAALSLGATAVVALFKKASRKKLVPAFKQNLRYLMIALALLVPAAIIETYLTPVLLGQ